MPNTVSASLPIKVARQNYYATLAIDVQRSLAQTWDDTTNQASPDWETDTSKQPILTPVINCPISYNIVSIEWFRDGVSIGSTVGVPNPASYSISTSGVLTILKNLASAGNTDPDTFTCKVSIRVNNVVYNLERSVSATILPASADGYAVVVEADRTALSSETGKDHCTLTASVYYKGKKTTTNVTYQWYKGGVELTSETNASLSVTRNDVDWEQLYRVEVRVGGVLQGVGSIVVTDQADNYSLSANISGDVTDTTPATIDVQLRQRKAADSAWSNFAMPANYTANLYDVADTDHNQVANGTLDSTGKGSFTVSAAQMTGKGIEAGYVDIVATW